MNHSSAVAAGLAEPSIPRSNGTPIFDAPWQGRALAIAILLTERHNRPWDDFRQHLIGAINESPDRPYWESFANALQAFTTALHLTDDARPTQPTAQAARLILKPGEPGAP